MTDVPIAYKPYRPSNGTEGDWFMSQWCEQCKAYGDPDDFDSGCKILAMTFAVDINDKEYPEQWRYDDTNSPTCTAFEHVSTPDKPYRCSNTEDMFS